MQILAATVAFLRIEGLINRNTDEVSGKVDKRHPPS